MWPEYRPKVTWNREVLGLSDTEVFDHTGGFTKIRSYEDLVGVVEGNSVILFTDSLVDWIFLFDCVHDKKNKVICNKDGKPLLVRMGHGCKRNKGTITWIVCSETWHSKCDNVFLDSLAGFYQYMGCGICPTPSSVGGRLMRMMQYERNLPRHTALPLSCENFIHSNDIGGIVQTPGKGKEYTELLELDMASAYLSTFVELPTGTPIRTCGISAMKYPAFFVQCEITIKRELALGVFPIRKGNRVIWPTLEGKYNACLWGFQIRDAIQAGCNVSLSYGWAWPRITTDTMQWAQHMYDRRIKAPTDFDEMACKVSAVGAIGRHGMSREGFILSEKGEGRCVIDRNGNPYDLWVTSVVDESAAYMAHWRSYSVSLCNSVVYNFAKSYATEGRLVAIDYDSILILEKDETHTFVKKKSIAALNERPGTWMWTKLHNVKVRNHRSYEADEKKKLPGIKKQLPLDKHLELCYT